MILRHLLARNPSRPKLTLRNTIMSTYIQSSAVRRRLHLSTSLSILRNNQQQVSHNMVAAASSSNQITRLLRFVDSSNQIHYGVPVDDNIKGYRKDVTEAYIVDTKNSNDIYATISS